MKTVSKKAKSFRNIVAISYVLMSATMLAPLANAALPAGVPPSVSPPPTTAGSPPPSSLPAAPTLPALTLPTGSNNMPASPGNPAMANNIMPMPTTVPDTSLPLPLPMSKNDKANKTADAIDIKVPDSVKDVVKKLDTTGSVTLDDLNNARQAMAKIDALIEIEKRLSELDKLRQEHDGISSKAIAAAIPASAMTPPPLPQFTPPSMPSLNANIGGQNNNSPPNLNPMGSSSMGGEINRIIGTGGRYEAVVKNGDQSKIIQVGDHLDGGTVVSISRSSVDIEQNKTIHTIHVKNVDTVFGNSP